MFYIYIIKNKNGQYYVGYTADLKRRIKEHWEKKVKTTRRLYPKRLVYYEAYSNQEAAKTREKKLEQHGSAFQGLMKRLGL